MEEKSFKQEFFRREETTPWQTIEQEGDKITVSNYYTGKTALYRKFETQGDVITESFYHNGEFDPCEIIKQKGDIITVIRNGEEKLATQLIIRTFKMDVRDLNLEIERFKLKMNNRRREPMPCEEKKGQGRN